MIRSQLVIEIQRHDIHRMKQRRMTQKNAVRANTLYLNCRTELILYVSNHSDT